MKTLKEKTASGLFWGVMSNGSTQILTVVIGIVLARLLSTADYGLVGMLAMFTAIAGALQESGFTSALVNLDKPEDNDYNSVFWFSLLMGLSLYALLFLCAPLIAMFFHQPKLIELSKVAFLTIPISAIGIVPQAYLFKNLKVKETTYIRITANIVMGVVGITMALNGNAYWSLVWQQITYTLITSFGKFLLIPWRPSLHIDFSPVKRMFGFSCKIMFSSIVNTISNNILTFIFGRLFSAGTVGNFSQASKWNATAHTLVSGTVAQVAQPVFTSVGEDNDRLINVFRKMIRFTAFLAFPVMFGLAIISQEFIIIAIGKKWIDSIALLQILCISGAFLPLHAIYQNLIISKGRSDIYMWCNIGLIAGSIITILVMGRFGIEVMVGAYSLLNILWVGVWQYCAKRIIGIHHRDIIMDVAPFCLAAFAVMAVTFFIASYVDNIVLRLTIKIILAAILYFITMKLAHVKMLDECLNFLFHRKA